MRDGGMFEVAVADDVSLVWCMWMICLEYISV